MVKPDYFVRTISCLAKIFKYGNGMRLFLNNLL